MKKMPLKKTQILHREEDIWQNLTTLACMIKALEAKANQNQQT